MCRSMVIVMQVVVRSSAQDFLEATRFLRAEDPIMTNLLGAIATAVASGVEYEDELWLTIEDQGRVVACAVRTAPWPLVVSQMPAGAVHALASYLMRHLPNLDHLTGPPDTALEITRAMRRTAVVRTHERVRVLRALRTPRPCGGRARRATSAEHAILVTWFTSFSDEADLPVSLDESIVRSAVDEQRLWLWVDEAGEPVAMAGHARLVTTSSGTVGRIGPVYTEPQHRRQGFGTAITHAVATHLLTTCDVVMLFTDAANLDSNSVYEQLGFETAGEIVELSIR